MKATLGLGAELDIASGAEVKDMGDSILSAFNSRKDPLPIRSARTNTAVADGTNKVIISFGSPAVGCCWHLISVSTFGTDDHTVVNSIVGGLYIGGSVLNPSLANLIVPGISFPAFVPLGDTGLYINAQETLFVTTSSAPTLGQQFGVNLRYEEWRLPEQNRLSGT